MKATAQKLLTLAVVMLVSVPALGRSIGPARTQEPQDEPIWMDEEKTRLYFVSEAQIAGGGLRDLPLDQHCQESLEARLSSARRHQVEFVPPPARRVTTDPSKGPEAITIAMAIDRWPEIVLARVVSVTNGYQCWVDGVSQRVDLQVEEGLRGSFATGDRLAIVVKGGYVQLDDVYLWEASSEYFPLLAAGDQAVVAGRRLNSANVSALEAGARFRVIKGVLEPIPHPLIRDTPALSLQGLRESLLGGTQ